MGSYLNHVDNFFNCGYPSILSSDTHNIDSELNYLNCAGKAANQVFRSSLKFFCRYIYVAEIDRSN